MAEITLSSNFFRKERYSAYSNWRLAFWRENFQNSRDAGSKNIHITMEEIDDVVKVIFQDDGCGMTKQVLEDVYFQLGNTTKGENDIGGMGRARILTCFGMKNYRIDTLTNTVIGSGTSYEVFERPFVQGCRLEIDVDDTSIERMTDEIRNHLWMSQSNNCRVFINGVEWNNWCSRGRFVRELSYNDNVFANVYVNKSGSLCGNVIIRINGAAMYSVATHSKSQIVVEIGTAISKNVLTSNRDGMIYQYEKVLQNFLDELAVDTTSATRTRFKNKEDTFSGSGMFYTSPVIKIKQKHGEEGIHTAGFVGSKVIFEPDINSVYVQEDDLNHLFQHYDLDGELISDNIPTIKIMVETENNNVHKVINRYNPNNWRYTRINGKLVRQGSNMFKIISSYRIAIEEALRAYLYLRPNSDPFYWGLGWLFSDDTIARVAREGGNRIFFINPVDENGNLKYKLSSKKDLKRIMAIAKHEVSHLEEKWHDEDFARFLTNLDSEYNETTVYRRIKDEIKD